MHAIYWATAIFTAVSACVSAAFSFTSLRSSGNALVASMYAFSRSAALLAVSLVPLVITSRYWLLAAASSMTLVQALDACIGVRQRNVMKTVGPVLLAVINGVLLVLFVIKRG